MPGTRRLLQGGIVLVLIGIWELSVIVQPKWTFFIGSPLGVVSAISASGTRERLPMDILVTTWQALAGFLVGASVGTIVGLLLWLSPVAFVVSQPYVIFIGSVPIFSLGPIFVFWFGTGFASKLALVAVATFSVAVTQAYQGARHCDSDLVRLGIAFGATKNQLLWKLIAPSAVTWVIAGMRVNIGMALLGSVVGELISSRQGLGNLLVLAEGLYNINLMIGCMVLIGFVAIAFNSIVSPIEEWVQSYKSDLRGVLTEK